MEPAPPPARPKPRLRKIVAAAIGLVAVAATFLFVLPKIANYGDVWDVVQELSAAQVGVLAGATLLNLVTFAPPWQAALPGLGFIRAFVLTQTSTAATYLAPGGAAVGIATSYAMLRAWSFRGARIGLAAAILGAWNQFALLTFPVVGVALLAITHEHNRLLESVALIGLAVFVGAVVLFAVGLWTSRLARRLGDFLARLANRVLAPGPRGPVGWGGASVGRLCDERRVGGRASQRGARPPRPALARAHARGAGGAADGLAAAAHVPANTWRVVAGGERDRGLRGLVARAAARLAADHARRRRRRRGRPDGGARRLRRGQRRGRGRRARLPLPDDRPDSPPRRGRTGGLAPASPADG